MKRLLLLVIVVAGAGGLGRAESPLYITPDVPTTPTAGPTLLPWQIFRYNAAGPTYTLVLTVPGEPRLDGIHKLDAAGDWLFSIDAASDLSGSLSADAEPRDVIHYDSSAGSYSLFFCGGAVGIPEESNVDALYLEGGDGGNLIVSFDVPTSVGASPTFEPADLVRFEPAAGAACSDWVLSASNPAFDASAAGTGGVEDFYNLIGADAGLGDTVLAMDVPARLDPSLGPADYVPGQLAKWDGASFDLFEALTGWPDSSRVDGVACLANPGSVPSTGTGALRVSKAVSPATDLVLDWSASCSEGAEDYGIYEGTIGTWYSHTDIDCEDASGDLTEQVTPGAGNRYYLVVAHNAKSEGSYGSSDNFPPGFDTERPVGAATCAASQVITSCP